VFVELREDDDGVQFEVAKTMVKRRPQILPAAVLKCDWRLGPGLCRAEHGGGRRARVDSGKQCSYQRSRRSRRPWWQSLQGRGAREPREFLAGISTVDNEIQVKSLTSNWCAS
jgi:hypothetical protein